MPFLNKWTPPPVPSPPPVSCHLDTPPSEYDLNFSGGPIPQRFLRTDKVLLVPFIPSLHARQCHAEMQGRTEIMRLMPYPKNMAESLEELLQGVEISMRSVPVSTGSWMQ